MPNFVEGPITTEKLRDRDWRLDHLYRIVDATGNEIEFRMNDVQRALLNDQHACNVILKARQLGFTTFIQLLMLDACLFNDNVRAGTIAHTLQDAERIFHDKIKFPYDNLPDFLRNMSPATQDSARTLTFSNNSSLRVGTSLRSGTFQYLHISELGHIAAQRPDKAREIKTGALNTVQSGQSIFVESTAQGREGVFYDLCKQAQSLAESNRSLTDLDFKFHFVPWYVDPRYRLENAGVAIGDEDRAYFEKIEAGAGVTLDAAQRAWYVKKAVVQGEDMCREYPSTPEEAFAASVEGSYYGRELSRARREGRIGNVPFDPSAPVNTFWDLGVDDETAIWFHQRVGREHRFIDYYAAAGEGLSHYARVLKDTVEARDFVYGEHYLPHDVEVRSLSTGTSRLETLKELGIRPVRVAPRTASVADDIQAARLRIAGCWFDETRCARGLLALETYRKEWDEKLGTFRNRPLHNWASHAADAFRCFAVAYRERAGAALPDGAAGAGGGESTAEMMDSPWE